MNPTEGRQLCHRAARRLEGVSLRRARTPRGFSLIALLIVVAIIGIIAAIAIPNLLASRRAANEASAISAVRNVSSAEESYRATYGAGAKFGTFPELVAQQMVDSVLADATDVSKAKSGYIYALTVAAGGGAFCIGAAPAADHQGTRNFSSDTPGVIFVHTLDVANPPASTAGGTAMR